MADHSPNVTKKVDFIRRDKVHVQIERALCDGLPYHRTIDEIPAADVRPVVRGKWGLDPQCPVCGEDRYKGLDADIWADWEPPFCPNCGADMRGDKNGQIGEKDNG